AQAGNGGAGTKGGKGGKGGGAPCGALYNTPNHFFLFRGSFSQKQAPSGHGGTRAGGKGRGGGGGWGHQRRRPRRGPVHRRGGLQQRQSHSRQSQYLYRQQSPKRLWRRGRTWRGRGNRRGGS